MKCPLQVPRFEVFLKATHSVPRVTSIFLTPTKYIFLKPSWHKKPVLYLVLSKNIASNITIVSDLYSNQIQSVLLMFLCFFLKIIRGSYIFGRNWTQHVIFYAMRISKMYILLRLEMLRVKIILGTLCPGTWLAVLKKAKSAKEWRYIELG